MICQCSVVWCGLGNTRYVLDHAFRSSPIQYGMLTVTLTMTVMVKLTFIGHGQGIADGAVTVMPMVREW